MRVSFGTSGNCESAVFDAAADDSIYFHSSYSGLPPSNELGPYPVNIRSMDRIKPTQDFFSISAMGQIWFVTPPLSAQFTFENITVKLYHNTATSTTSANITIGWYDEENHPHIVLSEDRPLIEGATNSSLMYNLSLPAQANERLLILIFIHTDTTWPNLYYDYKDHESGIQYSGTALYLPEFSTATISVFLLSTIATVLVLKTLRRIKNKTNS